MTSQQRDKAPRNRVVVIGSLNADLVAKVDRQPDTGETVLGRDFERIPGGKGLNQAIATARAGAHVTMIGAVGNDDLAELLTQAANDANIDTSHLQTTNGPSGIALITVANDASNRIIVIAGANASVTTDTITKNQEPITQANVVMAQLETPIESTLEAFKIARDSTAITILNAAPAQELPDELYPLTNYLVVNEYEAGLLSHINVEDEASAVQAANALISMGTQRVVVTLGASGSVLVDQYGHQFFEPYKVTAVDTTAAGDAFVGSFAAALAKGANLGLAMKHANAAGALTATKPGAVPSIPTGKEVNDFVLTQAGYDIPQ